MKKTICLVICMLATVGCAKKAVTVHPGAISNLDSYAYDILLVEQASIDQARTAYQAGQMPESAKAAFNIAVAQYNVAQSAWQGYHASGANASALQQAIDSLVAAMGDLMKLMPNKNVLKPVGFGFPVESKPVSLGGIYVHYAYA